MSELQPPGAGLRSYELPPASSIDDARTCAGRYPLPPLNNLDYEHVFLSRAFVQTTLPHSRPKGPIFVRENGALRVTLVSPDEHGLPYGLIPRLVLMWICTQVCYLKSRAFEFPDTFYAFLRAVGVDCSGQNARAARRHMDSLFRMMFDVTYRAERNDPPSPPIETATSLLFASRGFRISDEYELWWNSRRHEQRLYVRLSERFYEYAQLAQIPLDWAVLRRLRSPLALDIYAWLVHRTLRILQRHAQGKPPEFVPWRRLQFQFGSEYGDLRDFARRFRRALAQVLQHHPHTRLRAEYGGLRLLPVGTRHLSLATSRHRPNGAQAGHRLRYSPSERSESISEE